MEPKYSFISNGYDGNPILREHDYSAQDSSPNVEIVMKIEGIDIEENFKDQSGLHATEMLAAKCDVLSSYKIATTEKEERNEDDIDSGKRENSKIEVKYENIDIEDTFTHQSGVCDRMTFTIKSEDSCSVSTERPNFDDNCFKEDDRNNGIAGSESTEGVHQKKELCNQNYDSEDAVHNVKNITAWSSRDRNNKMVYFDDEMSNVKSDLYPFGCISTKESNLQHVDSDVLCSKNHKCHLCDYASPFKANLRIHFGAIHLNLKNHKCRFCDYTTNSKSNLKRHTAAIHLKKHECHFCDYASNQNSWLKNHIEKIHFNLKNHKCHLCDYSSTERANLKMHLEAVHLKLKNHKCHLCDYTATLKMYLKRHIDTIHLKLKNHKCDLCDFATSKNRDLEEHIAAVHSKIKNHKCHLCDFATCRKNSLKIHFNGVHLKLKIHKCHLCDYATNQKCHLQQHIDAIHSKLKNHKCHLCDYAATQKCTLKQHIDMVHLKLKNRKCHLCDYATIHSKTLKTHIKSVHLNLKETNDTSAI